MRIWLSSKHDKPWYLFFCFFVLNLHDKTKSKKLKRINPDRNIFSKNVELTSILLVLHEAFSIFNTKFEIKLIYVFRMLECWELCFFLRLRYLLYPTWRIKFGIKFRNWGENIIEKHHFLSKNVISFRGWGLSSV